MYTFILYYTSEFEFDTRSYLVYNSSYYSFSLKHFWEYDNAMFRYILTTLTAGRNLT